MNLKVNFEILCNLKFLLFMYTHLAHYFTGYLLCWMFLKLLQIRFTKCQKCKEDYGDVSCFLINGCCCIYFYTG